METCDLSRLNPAGFERLIRALSFKLFGPGGVVFSSGPDGGRDFIFDGAIKGYEPKSWNGYLVLQAKFQESNSQPIEWLKRQIDSEFKKLSQAGDRIRLPQYYILATNVSLSGADGVSSKKTGRQRRGGYTKILELFDPWKKQFGLKDIDIWHAEKIIDLLANSPEIRQTYAAWVTPGDVLTKILTHFESKQPNFKTAISRSLKISLSKDQHVRLKDAGSVDDSQIRTSQVFVDLPIDNERRRKEKAAEQVVREGETVERVPNNVVARLVDRAKEKLDPETLFYDEESQPAHQKRPARNRIVLMGGPGQGKSTASLFITQIFRAAILESDAATKRDHSVKRLVPEILERAENLQVSRQVPHRYPVHVSLPRFADAISHAKDAKTRLPSLLAYIASELSETCDEEVDRDDLRKWLQQYPWLLVLDGLDEVPPTGERPAVLTSITNFFTEVSEANADVLVIVTTRPQGYNKDLDDALWSHWRLAELNSEEALNYAKAFGEARYPEDRSRREEVFALVRKAAAQPATARLMITPLQVTILHFIVDTGGGVPTARWTLFNEYFEILKRREKAKGGDTQKILERNWQQIGPIHHRAGLILQTDSEHTGGAGSRFSHERFRQLIHSYLISEGFKGEDLNNRIEELMSLALHRLVLLSTREEGFISFDVRSLQEFMAAAAITSGDQMIMEQRLNHIAIRSHWRHVFLIAASRCFADDSFHYRRATIIAIPRQIDTTEPDMLTRNGARLSLELLVDGIGLDHPLSRRPLLQHAVELLQLGPQELAEDLAQVWGHDSYDLAETAIIERINEDSSAAIAAWRLLFALSRSHEWAQGLLIRVWPTNVNMILELLTLVFPPFANQKIIDTLTNSLIQIGPAPIQRRLHSFVYAASRISQTNLNYEDFKTLGFSKFNYSSENRTTYNIIFKNVSARVTRFDIPDEYAPFAKMSLPQAQWAMLKASSDFVNNPNRNSLAMALRHIAENNNLGNAQQILYVLPWPLACILNEARDDKHLLSLSQDTQDGKRGDVDDWRKAEARWGKYGISREDLEITKTGCWFNESVAIVGAPYLLGVGMRLDREIFNVIVYFDELASQATNPNWPAAGSVDTHLS